MTDFWRSCGYHLLDRGPEGRLLITDAYLRTLFERPELAPVPESCPAEIALHGALVENPRRIVSASEFERLADADARENYGVALRFRDQLLAASTLEAFYAGLFQRDIAVPPDFIHQTVQVILRSILDTGATGLDARAAELFFRRQRVTVEHGAVMLADAATVSVHASDGGLGNVGRFLLQAQAPLKNVELDVLDENSEAEYWKRDERFDTVLSINPGRPGSLALARVIRLWIRHFHGVDADITPVREIPDEEWRWHVGLDAEATAMLNEIYNGGEVDEENMRRVIALFRADFPAGTLRAELGGAPVFIGLAMSAAGDLRLKPQNLLVNLPLARAT